MTNWLITWSPEGWPHEELLALRDRVQKRGSHVEPWRFQAHRSAKIGDLVFALKQGAGAKGIFAVGVVDGERIHRPQGKGMNPWQIPVKFTLIADPLKDFLIPESATREILGDFIRIRASGAGIPPAMADELLAYIAENLIEPDIAAPVPSVSDFVTVFVPPPQGNTDKKAKAKNGKMVARKVDWATRDAHNRSLGLNGELFVMKIEADRLEKCGRADLAGKITHASKSEGDGLGYDIRSFDEDGRTIFIEVKTTNGAITAPFFISEKELDFSHQAKTDFYLYRVHNFSLMPRIFTLQGSLRNQLSLRPTGYAATCV